MKHRLPSRIVSFNGTFDGELHPGHKYFFAKASKHGDLVIAFINADATVQTNKHRTPLYNQQQRVQHVAQCLAHMDIKATVLPLQGTNEAQLAQIAAVKPHVYCFGHDNHLPFDAAIRRKLDPIGTTFVTLPAFQRDKYSTTRLHFPEQGNGGATIGMRYQRKERA